MPLLIQNESKRVQCIRMGRAVVAEPLAGLIFFCARDRDLAGILILFSHGSHL